MSLIAIQGDPNGTGTVTIAAPNTNTSRTISLPDASTTMVGTDTTQTLTNKTLGSGLVAAASLITSDTAKTATGTSIDFTGIPAWVKRITVMFNGVSTNGTSAIQIQIGSGSVLTTGYQSGSTSGTSNATSTTGFLVTNATLAANQTYGHLILTNVSGNIWISGGYVFQYSSYGTVSGGGVTLSGSLDRVRITTFNGTDTFDLGSIGLLYE